MPHQDLFRYLFSKLHAVRKTSNPTKKYNLGIVCNILFNKAGVMQLENLIFLLDRQNIYFIYGTRPLINFKCGHISATIRLVKALLSFSLFTDKQLVNISPGSRIVVFHCVLPPPVPLDVMCNRQPNVYNFLSPGWGLNYCSLS